MKNTRLKNVIFTAGMAVFTGVLLLGVNAAIGAATPTVNPPGAGVSPTFTGLNVNGNIQNSAGNVAVSDNLAVTGNVTATGSVSAVANLNASGNVSADGNLNVSGNASISGDANISGNVDISGTLSADSLITPAISDGSSNAVVINDGLIVNGPGASRIDGSLLNVNAVLRANNSIISMANGGAAPVIINDNMQVTGTSDLRGNVSDSNSAFTINDDLSITGQIEVNNDIVHGTPGEFVTVNGPFEATDLVNIGNNVMIQNDADITVTGNADIQGTIKNSLVDYYPTHIDDHDVTIDDDLTVTGSINVSGSLTADSIGSFTRPESAFQSIAAGGTAEASIACPANYNILSCGAQSSWTTPSYSWTRHVDLAYSWSSLWDNTCIVRGNNTHASANRYIKAIAVCWNPSSL